jgi:hypothetical protein
VDFFAKTILPYGLEICCFYRSLLPAFFIFGMGKLSYFKLLSIKKDVKIDSLHLAVCVVNQIDYLLTWNCKHLGPFTMQKIQIYNDAHGLFVPILTTPEAFFDEGEFDHGLF